MFATPTSDKLTRESTYVEKNTETQSDKKTSNSSLAKYTLQIDHKINFDRTKTLARIEAIEDKNGPKTLNKQNNALRLADIWKRTLQGQPVNAPVHSTSEATASKTDGIEIAGASLTNPQKQSQHTVSLQKLD